MPEMDGVTATEILLGQMPDVAVVVMSVQDDSYYTQRAFRAGARGYLVKPFPPDDLSKAIREARRVGPPWILGHGHH